MRHILITFIVTVTLLCTVSLQAQASTSGKDFWVSFGRNSDRAYQDISLQFRIVTTKYTQATVTFTETGEVMSLSLNANTVYTHNLTPAQKQAVYSNVTGKSSKSIHIQTDENVSVYAVNTMQLVTDATIILPTGALDNSYYHLSYIPISFVPDVPDGYTIVAVENNTTIYEDGVSKTVLNKGEVYSSYFSIDGTGKHITADNPVAYFVTHSCVFVPAGVWTCDCFYEQLHPESSWGNCFFVPVTKRGIERVRIIASQDNTTINFTGGALIAGSQTLNAGEWAEIEIYAAQNGCYIESSNPVGVVSYLTGYFYPELTYFLGDPSIVWIPPIEQFIGETLVAPFLAVGSSNITEHHLLIVTPTITKKLTEISISGGDYTALTGGTWSDHSSGYSYYNLPLSNEDVSYSLKNPEKLIVLGYGLGFQESYYYLAGAAARRLDAYFKVNGIHYRSLDNKFYCNENIEVEAFVRCQMDAAPGHLRWLINDVEQTAFTDSLRWATQLPPGSHTILMIVKDENGEEDSLATSFVITNMLDPVTIYETICQGDSVLFNGKYYNSPGLYTDVLQSALGCDGIVTLDLTVIPLPTVTVVERTVCQNDPVHLVFTGVAPFELDYTFNGTRQTITVSGMDTALVATQAGENIFGVYRLVSANACFWSEKAEEVEINGVIWATRNVDAPGAFAKNPEDAGMFYQWNRAVGWSSTDPRVSSNGSSWNFTHNSNATAWATSNNVCPAGYRVPTRVELQKLVDAGSQWTRLNGVAGRMFGSGYETIFLPAAGYRNSSGELYGSNDSGRYWSSIGINMGIPTWHAYCMLFGNRDVNLLDIPRTYTFPVRCVKSSTQTTPVQKETITVLLPATFDTIPKTICSNDSVLFHGKYYNQTGLYTITLGCDNVTLDLTVIPVATVTVAEKTICQDDAVHLIFTGVAPFELDYVFNGTREIITVFGMDTTLADTQVGENIFEVNHLFSAGGCEIAPGVGINGVVWATRNVGLPGIFVKNPEDAGMLYQWNSKVGWSSTDPLVSTDGSAWNENWWGNGATTWETTNNVCPRGYRVPTQSELQRLADANSQWTTLNGVTGRIFGSGDETIFLPAAGERIGNGVFKSELRHVGTNGLYWSNTAYKPLDNAIFIYYIHFGENYVSNPVISTCTPECTFSVRCVKASTQTPPVQTETITVNLPTFDTVSITTCSNNPVLFNGTYYNQTGLYTATLQTVSGCDSIVTLDLTVHPAYNDDIIYDTICQGQDYNLHNLNLTNVQYSTVRALHYWTAAFGCDSIVTLYLTVNPVDTTRINETIRVGEGYNENGFEIPVQNADTTIYKTLHWKNQNLCDSTVILTLKVKSCVPDMVPVFDSICEGEPYYFDGKILSESGIYVEYGKNSEDCDSVTVLDFKVLPSYNEDIHEEIVIGETYIFNGRTYNKGGVYSERFVTVSDCDSVVTLYLNVVPRCPKIEIPSFFTPDADGINDYWKIKNIECYSYHKVALYDRFGKELFVWENNFPEIGWDGAYLSKRMPSTDYWYVIMLEVEEIENNYVGHFTLLR